MRCVRHNFELRTGCCIGTEDSLQSRVNNTHSLSAQMCGSSDNRSAGSARSAAVCLEPRRPVLREHLAPNQKPTVL